MSLAHFCGERDINRKFYFFFTHNGLGVCRTGLVPPAQSVNSVGISGVKRVLIARLMKLHGTMGILLQPY